MSGLLVGIIIGFVIVGGILSLMGLYQLGKHYTGEH
jgi:hypothetical protein